MNKLLLSAIAISALSIGTTAAIAGHHEDGDHKNKMMERIDTDGDGFISKAEFMAKHEEKFAKMDLNNDGKLAKDELEAAKAKMKEKWQDMKGKKMEDKKMKDKSE